MDELKRRVLELLDSGQFRFAKHFRRRRAERAFTDLDALRALRNGTLDLRRCEGNNLAFLGTDTADRRVCVIFRVDDEADRLVILSMFPLATRRR
jgi:hypothetical protein